MATPLHNELKKEFQLERLILFSDAVFAIAITILVIEIKVPSIDRHIATEELLLHSLDEMVPKFIGFIFSFLIVGLYWTIHHRMFGYVVSYTNRTLWLNLFFLLAVVLMPFSTAFYSEYILRMLKTPMILYVSNISFLGLMSFFLWRHISNPDLHLTEGLSKEERSYFSFRALVIPVIFITEAIVYIFLDPRLALWFPPFIPLVMRLIRRRYKKRQQTA